VHPESINSLSIEQKVGQLFIIGLPGPELTGDSLKLFREIQPGGVCLFTRNIREAEQTRLLTDAVRANSSIAPLISIDQEGGLVDRLRRLVTPMPAAAEIATSEQAAELGRITGELLRLLGLNIDFAPVVDVATPERSAANNGIYSRTFGESAVQAEELAGSFLSALQNAGCLGCLKHFPGLGATSVDSHEELPTVPIQAEEFEQVDLVPFRTLIPTVPAVMVAHASYPNVHLQEQDQNGKLLPSSLSYSFVTKLLREEMGFEGAAITDDLEMGAILKNYGIGEACKMAVQAGEDLLAICADPGRIREGYRAVLNAVKEGAISEDRLDVSLTRIGELKSRLFPPLTFDQARLDSLSSQIAGLKESLT
jgi:beta-N-acetylhexosaminidase